VKESLDKGATIAYGELNYKVEDPNLKDGFFFHPMILENVKEGQPAYHEELFGPVFSLFKVANLEEAVELANDSIYGLSACVFS